MDRKARLLSTSDRSSRIVEIGPGYNPVAPKAGGWRTYVVDCADRPALRAKYSAAAVDLDAIEDVDTIWQEGPLDEAMPAELRGGFDTLIASHVIEHAPDFAGFLLAAQRLVRPGGSVALAIPDRRFCFDFFRPPSSTLRRSHRCGMTFLLFGPVILCLQADLGDDSRGSGRPWLLW